MKTEIALLGADASHNERILAFGADIIKRGGLVAFPTETVYGLGANALDADAAKKIYAAKGRPSDNPLIIHLAKVEDADKYAFVPDTYYKLAEAFMPGPLTVIMPKRDNIPCTVTGGLETVAVRVPSHTGARRLIELAGVPIAAPSANLSGRPSPTEYTHVVEDMDGRIDMIIGAGPSEIGLESTIVKLDDSGATLLRPGGITVEMLEAVLGEIKIDKAVKEKLDEGEKPMAPGMKYRHYAPRAPLALVEDRELLFKYASDKKSAFIVYDEDAEKLIDLGADEKNILTLGKENDTRAHASRLFALLRLCDSRGYEKIYAPMPKSDGLSLAVYNRIIKAAGYSIIKK
jgi:L-threonylcarbamoyladenylate synthase